jgi:hypothetical protein
MPNLMLLVIGIKWANVLSPIIGANALDLLLNSGIDEG